MGVDIQDVRVFRQHSWEEDFSDTVVQFFADTDFARSRPPSGMPLATRYHPGKDSSL